MDASTIDATSTSPLEIPALPAPVSRVANHYYLHHAPTIAYLRAAHNILGSAIGTLPQANQQNLFLGLPLLLLPEEARLLCERGLAFIVDDVAAHRQGVCHLQASGSGQRERDAFDKRLAEIGRGIGETIAAEKARERQAAMSKFGSEEMRKRAIRAQEKAKTKAAAKADQRPVDAAEGEGVGNDEQRDRHESANGTQHLPHDVDVHYSLTPAASYPPLKSPAPDISMPLPDVPPSYALFRHLHQQGYFMHPGLRFGCQYMAYPGDPLRFHSHFLVLSREWDEEVQLSTIIGSGRLGTGVKKGFLLGGEQPQASREIPRDGDASGDVRCFSIEWGGM